MTRRARRRKPRAAPAAPALNLESPALGAHAVQVAAHLLASGAVTHVYETLWILAEDPRNPYYLCVAYGKE